nr:immunoglobulin heavy chain junction region [Mus musculus]
CARDWSYGMDYW